MEFKYRSLICHKTSHICTYIFMVVDIQSNIWHGRLMMRGNNVMVPSHKTTRRSLWLGILSDVACDALNLKITY